MGLELREVVDDGIEVLGVFFLCDLSENLVSSFFSLIVFCSNLSKASVDLGLCCQVLYCFRAELIMKLGKKLSMVLDTNLAQEGAKVLKVLILNSLLLLCLSLNLGELEFLIRLLINLSKLCGLSVLS